MTNTQSDVSGLLFENPVLPFFKAKKLIRRSSRGRTPEGEPNPVDVFIGSRLKLRRTLLGWSQEDLAAKTGLTFQQIQKYERGMNRIGGSRMWDLCCVMDVEPNYFYEDMPEDIRQSGPRWQYLHPKDLNPKDDIKDLPYDPMKEEISIKLVMAFRKIGNRQLAKCLYDSMINAAKSTWQNEEVDWSDTVSEPEPVAENEAKEEVSPIKKVKARKQKPET